MKTFVSLIALGLLACGCTNSAPTTTTSTTTTSSAAMATSSSAAMATTSAAVAGTWSEFKAENGAFTAMFPAAVKVDKPGDQYNAKAEPDADHSFGVDWSPVAKTVPVDEKMMTGMVEAMEKQGGKVVSKEITTLAGVPAAHITVDASDRKAQFWYAIAENGLYTIEVSNAPAATPVAAADQTKFLESIKFTPGTAAAGTPAAEPTAAAEEQAGEDATATATP